VAAWTLRAVRHEAFKQITMKLITTKPSLRPAH